MGFFKRIKERKNTPSEEAKTVEPLSVPEKVEEPQAPAGELVQPEAGALVEVSPLPADFSFVDYSLMRIEDPTLVQQICRVVPGFAAAIEGLSDASGSTAYKAILPTGVELDASKEVAGAVRGSFRDSGGKIAGQASFLPLSKVPALISGVAGVAVAVAQTGMMSKINKDLARIEGFAKKNLLYQQAELQGKIEALLLSIQKIYAHAQEVGENEELRKRELQHLNSLEDKGLELLFEVDKLLQTLAHQQDVRFKAFAEKSKDAARYLDCKYILESILSTTASLQYALEKGTVSKDYCLYPIRHALTKGEEAQSAFTSYLAKEQEIFHIDLNEKTRKRDGILGAVGRVIDKALKKEALSTMDVTEETASHLLALQKKTERKVRLNEEEEYARDVVLIQKEGKIYYAERKEA